MLGELIGEMEGKVSSQRVIDVKGPTMETSVTASGRFRGVQVTKTGTSRHTPVKELAGLMLQVF
jgi:hypothetical protein